MAESVRGTLPTPVQRNNAKILFYDGENCNIDKVAAQVSMHRDAIAECQDLSIKMHRCMYGDADTGFIGNNTMIAEIYKVQTGQDATTKKTRKPDGEIMKYMWMILGGLTLLAFLITAGMITFNNFN